MNNDELRLPFGLLKLELMCRRNILHREILHNTLVWRYFTTYKTDNTFISALRYHFNKLSSFFKQLSFIVEKINEKIDDEEVDLRKLNSLTDDNKLRKFFETYFKASLLLKNALEKLDFFHHKAYYLLESFPSYFPNPNVFRMRQELKAYEILEQISEKWLEYFKNSELTGKDLSDFQYITQVYWECDTENIFVQPVPIDLDLKNRQENGQKKRQINFLFKGSYYIVNCPSLWILLAHEALHFILKLQKTPRLKQNEIYERLRSNFLIEIEALKHHLNIYVNPVQINNIYEDTICDAILTNLLKESYYTALWRIVFGFDEIIDEEISIDGSGFSTSLPGWWIRLYVCAKILQDDRFIKALEKFHEILMSRDNNSEFEIRVLAEKHIADRLFKHAEYLLKKVPLNLDDKLKKELFYDISDKLYQHLKNEIEEKDEIKIKELREGRIFSSLFITDRNIEENAKDITVILLRFMKVRLDGYSDNEKSNMQNKLCAILEMQKERQFESDFVFFNLGSFQLASIHFDFHDKDDLNKNILMDLFKDENKVFENKNGRTFLEVCIQNKLLFFSYEISAHILFLAEYHNNQCKLLDVISCAEKIKKFFKNCNNIVIVISIELHKERSYPVKYQINAAKEMFEELLGEKLKNIWNNALIGQCFGWADFVLLLELKPDEKKSYFKPLQVLKKTFHQIHEIRDFKINRTFTSVMIPVSVLFNKSDYKIIAPEIVIRYPNSSKHEDSSQAFSSNCWEKLILPGIFDLKYRYKKKEITIQDLYNEIKKIHPFSISDLQFRINIPSSSNVD